MGFMLCIYLCNSDNKASTAIKFLANSKYSHESTRKNSETMTKLLRTFSRKLRKKKKIPPLDLFSHFGSFSPETETNSTLNHIFAFLLNSFTTANTTPKHFSGDL